MRDARKAWYENPWLWGGCGCCGGCLVLPLLLIALAGGTAFVAVARTGVLQDAKEIARNHPALQQALGEPVEVGWMMQGNINVSNDRGEADFSLPVSGPHGEGRLYVEAEKVDGEWIFRDLYAVVDGIEEPIDLLGSGPQQLEEP
jgi:hypothetical protein